MKPILATISAFAVIVLLFLVLSSPASDSSLSTDNSPPGEQTINQEQAESEVNRFTLSEIATHNTSDDCWTVIDDIVYDVTSYVKNHPGGEAILAVCGVDGTADFKNQGAPQDVADEIRAENNLPQDTEFHSPHARDVLRTLQIGELAS